MTREEFCDRFKAYMLERVGRTHFDDGKSIAAYAEQAAPTYWEDPSMALDGPEGCAEADMSYWGEE